MIKPLVFSLFAFAGAYTLALPVKNILKKKGIVDKPNQRSSHHEPTVRGGGISFVSIILLTGLFITSQFQSADSLAIMGGAALVAMVSLIDDIRSLSSRIRFLSHASAALLYLSTVTSTYSQALWGGGEFWNVILVIAICALWTVGYTNAFNFMDGINGIACAQAIITSIGMGVITGIFTNSFFQPSVLLTFAVSGAVLGFLPYNFPRARMFMGDVGSAFLGYLLATLLIWMVATTSMDLLLPLILLHCNFFMDTGITLVRRILRKECWHSAHREHFYQRLVRAGKSHAFVTGTQISLQLLVMLLMVLTLHATPITKAALYASVPLLWIGYFTYAEIIFRKSQQTFIPSRITIAYNEADLVAK